MADDSENVDKDNITISGKGKKSERKTVTFSHPEVVYESSADLKSSKENTIVDPGVGEIGKKYNVDISVNVNDSNANTITTEKESKKSGKKSSWNSGFSSLRKAKYLFKNKPTVAGQVSNPSPSGSTTTIHSKILDEEQALEKELNSISSNTFRIQVQIFLYEKTYLGVINDILDVFFSFVSCVFFIVKIYLELVTNPPPQNPVAIQTFFLIDTIFSFFFGFDYLLQVFLSDNRLPYIFSMVGIAELASVFTGVSASSSWGIISFVR